MKISKTSFMTLLLAVIMFLPLNIAMAKNIMGEHWQILAASKAGTFTYDENSLKPIPVNVAPKDIVIMGADAAAYIDDQSFLGLVDESLQKKVKKDESIKKVALHLNLNLSDRTYKITEASIFSNTGKLIEKKKLTPKFQAIPANTFVAVLCDKAQALVASWQKAAEPKRSDCLLSDAPDYATPAQKAKEK